MNFISVGLNSTFLFLSDLLNGKKKYCEFYINWKKKDLCISITELVFQEGSFLPFLKR